MKTLTWTNKTPTKEGAYWFRSDGRTLVLNVFDPSGAGVMMAWSFHKGRMGLWPIANHDGEWCGPIYPPG